MKPAEIRDMTLDDLKLKIGELSKEFFNIKLQHAMGRLDNPMRIPQIKKDIARINTIMREKELEKRA
ncbi:MAG: 50S ribosomal protein L29 [Deltaproteobacteria bacterium GWC2_42_51]|nr:MAG: 50S ribosomal protein L29 [Deltaproteobacteria bacterium GWA2_42_85]OGP26702.1 MAG: 50S ribosomal protein L29 [Deltaproteobacteria bacterium GWB2_42_7]OGP32691.1 MAG: 50S ribosomal protein L29 [Deltaproteobacteria bacterium GWC2_42_51]OGP39119.1 MAG: 50S ribosomal protein L29 [Deltaproteobacteria bacterium GWD2_42_10]OGP47947.1 MAG: 50S ribosomal protein L29 [Deltaproteobacteria bacterium GWF2_42_12]OGQ24776.1 MAG: 50S ribosomal protein L29 [Deltaproteobacteria bacterium RIFCSPHIGHO2_0